MHAFIHRTAIVFFALASVHCSAVDDPKVEVEIDDQADESTETDTEAGDGETTPPSTETDTSNEDATDEETGTTEETESTSETGDMELPGCCWCIDAVNYTCFAWTDGEESCLAWNAGLTMSYDSDCPEAWTASLVDDLLCDASCLGEVDETGTETETGEADETDG